MYEIYKVNSKDRKMWKGSINIHDETLLSNGFVIAKNFKPHEKYRYEYGIFLHLMW